jgi:hypothetical protein
MARIFVNEYCLVSTGASTRAGSDCVFVMSPASTGCRFSTSPDGLEIVTSRTPHG